jgi:hypothetical protein
MGFPPECAISSPALNVLSFPLNQYTTHKPKYAFLSPLLYISPFPLVYVLGAMLKRGSSTEARTQIKIKMIRESV